MPPMNRLSRRDLIVANPNPETRLDYVVRLEGHMAGGPDGTTTTSVGVCYVPDKAVLDPGAFGRYLEALATQSWSSLEEVATVILDDINNEVVARWVQVRVSAPQPAHPGVDTYGVMLEDRQPKWDNPALLARLERY